jgi:hypothetical protein
LKSSKKMVRAAGGRVDALAAGGEGMVLGAPGEWVILVNVRLSAAAIISNSCFIVFIN